MFSKGYVYHDKIIKKIYPSRIEYVFLPSSRESGFEEISGKTEKPTIKSEVERISTSRIKAKIKDFSECNDFQFFYTQTISQNRFNLEDFKDTMQKKFKAYKRKNKDFIYLIIFEKHKNGAFHLHGLIGGVNTSDLYINNNGYLSLKFFDDIGFNSISKIKDKMKISNYILKYITKDFQKTDSGYSYFHSKNLKVPICEIISSIPSNARIIFENDYIKKWVVNK